MVSFFVLGIGAFDSTVLSAKFGPLLHFVSIIKPFWFLLYQYLFFDFRVILQLPNNQSALFFSVIKSREEFAFLELILVFFSPTMPPIKWCLEKLIYIKLLWSDGNRDPKKTLEIFMEFFIGFEVMNTNVATHSLLAFIILNARTFLSIHLIMVERPKSFPGYPFHGPILNSLSLVLDFSFCFEDGSLLFGG